jgi:hypothetical protein
LSNKPVEAGYGLFGGDPCYWDNIPPKSNPNANVTNIFPGGMPNGNHEDEPHEHIVVDNDTSQIVYWRDEDGDVLIDSNKGICE